MAWYNNIKIGERIILGFSIPLTLMAALLGIDLNALEQTHTELEVIVKVENLRTKLANEMLDDGREISINIRDVLLVRSPAEKEAAREKIAEQSNEYREHLRRFEVIAGKDVNLDIVNQIKAHREAVDEAYNEVLALARADKHDEAVASLDEKAKPRADYWVKSLNALARSEDEHTLLRFEGAQKLYAEARQWMFILGVVSLAVSVGVVIFLTGSITRPLNRSVQAANRIAAGDLRVDFSVAKRRDELGVLTQSHNQMGENLREQIRGLGEGANALASSASEIVAASSQLTSSATESAAAVSETTITVEEVRQTALVAGQKAEAVADSAKQAAQNAEDGRKSTDDVVAGMCQIRQQMEAIAASMVRLSEQGQAIGQIVASVDDLAAQSNLLAVNAALEASRAGEHGKGFKVVAQEVRSLAEQSRRATNQVRTILSEIQKATTAAVMATEQGGKAVASGERQTAAAGESIEALANSVAAAAQAAMQIAASGQQQLVGVDQVAAAMVSIKQSSTQNVSSAKQLETAAHDLNDLGTRLKQMVEKYKV